MPVSEFRAFSLEHLLTLGGLAVFCLFLSRILKTMPDAKRKMTGRIIGCSLIAYTVTFYIQQGLEGMLRWEYSLPLELCNLVLAACILALFLPGRLQCEITYFWGLGGATQALITPDLGRGFPSWDFMLFFWSHGALMLGIVFIIVGANFRPARKSVLRMMIALNLYAVVVGTIDWLTGWNYGYLCRKPAVPSLLDYLGPWPWYIVSLEGVALMIFLLLYLLGKSRNMGT